MKSQLRVICGVLSVIMACGAVVHAQNANAPAVAPKAAPAAKAAKEAAKDAPKDLLGSPLVTKHDVAVDTIVDSNPQTPREFLRAATILADLGHPDLAKKYLQQVQAAKLDENALADLAAQVGADWFLRLAGNLELRPEGQAVADAVLGAAAKRARDPAHLQGAIDQLSDPSRTVQRDALVAIMAAHENAVPALVAALADPKRAAVSGTLKHMLVRIGTPAVEPLTAVLESDNARLKVQIIDVLGQLESRAAVPFLVAPATANDSPTEVRDAARSALLEIHNITRPTAEGAAKLLTAEIEKHLRHEQLLKPDSEGFVEIWRWDPQAGVPVRQNVPADQADAAMAARLAVDLLQLTSDDPRANRLFLISTLEAAANRSGLDHPLPEGPGTDFDRAAKIGTPALEDALNVAITTNHLPAAIAAVQVLGSSGDRTLLDATGATPRPLVLALSQRDRRLRFAAAAAIMKLDPKSGFAGSSDLISALTYFAGSSGTKRALVAFPNQGVAATLSGMLAAQGYDCDIATSGRAAFLWALSSGDYELMLLSSHIDRTPVWVALQQIRHDPRSARLPVILMAEDGKADLERMQNLCIYDPWTAAFERPVTPDAMKFFVERLEQQTASYAVPNELREQQAVKSLAWLKQLNQLSPREFDLQPYEPTIFKAFNVPKLSAAAAELLGSIGTHSAQCALVNAANRGSWPIELRQAAAAAFSQSVRKHGIQLTSDGILYQYQRYNESANEDPAVQQLLALILDAIELPTALSRAAPLAPAPRP